MDNFGVVGFVLFLVTFVFSYKGLKSLSALGKWEFSIERIVVYKEYQRLITSGFVHAIDARISAFASCSPSDVG